MSSLVSNTAATATEHVHIVHHPSIKMYSDDFQHSDHELNAYYAVDSSKKIRAKIGEDVVKETQLRKSLDKTEERCRKLRDQMQHKISLRGLKDMLTELLSEEKALDHILYLETLKFDTYRTPHVVTYGCESCTRYKDHVISRWRTNGKIGEIQSEIGMVDRLLKSFN